MIKRTWKNIYSRIGKIFESNSSLTKRVMQKANKIEKACEEEGHSGEIINVTSPGEDAFCLCRYCGATYPRPLTNKEKEMWNQTTQGSYVEQK